MISDTSIAIIDQTATASGGADSLPAGSGSTSCNDSSVRRLLSRAGLHEARVHGAVIARVLARREA
jgi:hypothetical protein